MSTEDQQLALTTLPDGGNDFLSTPVQISPFDVKRRPTQSSRSDDELVSVTSSDTDLTTLPCLVEE